MHRQFNLFRSAVPPGLLCLCALLMLLAGRADAQLYVRAAAGYGLSAGSDLIESNNPYYTPFSEAWEGIYSSYGKGLTVEGAIGMTVYSGLQIEVGVSYLKSTEYLATHPTSPLSQARHEANMLSFKPAIVLSFDGGPVFPFVRIGGVIASPHRKISTSFNTPGVDDYTAEDSGNLAWGFFGGIGCTVPLAEKLSLAGEVDLTEINWGPAEVKFASASSSQTLEYGDVVNYTSDVRFRPAIPFGQLGMKVGLQYAF